MDNSFLLKYWLERLEGEMLFVIWTMVVCQTIICCYLCSLRQLVPPPTGGAEIYSSPEARSFGDDDGKIYPRNG